MMDSNFANRPSRIAERLDAHFDNVEPQAKRLWTLIIQLSALLGEQANHLIQEADLNLTRGEITVLTCLRLSPEPFELRQSEISDRVLMTTGGVTNLCKHIVKRGWLVREKDPDDGRASLYRLTESGVDVANQIIPMVHSAEKALFSCIDKSEQEQLSSLLERVTSNVGFRTSLAPSSR